jgi:hypothetical protein
VSVTFQAAPERTSTRRLGLDSWFGLGVGAALVLLAFTTAGGEIGAPEGANTWVQIVLVLGAGALGGLVLMTGARGRVWGAGALWLFVALAVLTFLSMAWSVQPAASWIEGNGTLSYLAAFVIAWALARLFPARWQALIGALALYTAIVSVYALVTKVFPAAFAAAGAFPRVRAPFDYPNATGIVAAMGLPAWLWLAVASPSPRRSLRALSVPAIGALVCALVMSYGRGALAAAVVGLGLWFVFVPARLRGALVLACGAVGGALVSVWAGTQSGLTGAYTPLPLRVGAGHSFGIVLLVALAVLVAVGVAAAIGMERVQVSAIAQRRVATALVVMLALVPVAGLVGLAASSRGFAGEVSHLWSSLTSPKAGASNTPGRLGDLGSSRPRYWGDGLKVGEHALIAGSGAFGFATACKRYAALCVPDAHSYPVQTFADLGLIGVALSLALLVAWALAVKRTVFAGVRDWVDERVGLVTLLATVLIFGIHSTIDWTWFVPGAAIPALLCAGWLAGRGPLEAPIGRLGRSRRLVDAPLRAAGTLGLCALALLCAWFVWQPQRSLDARSAAIAALSNGNGGAALTDARTAVTADPVDLEARVMLATVYRATGNLSAARRELVHATSLQPSNPDSWRALASFDASTGRTSAAQSELARAHALDPHGGS